MISQCMICGKVRSSIVPDVWLPCRIPEGAEVSHGFCLKCADKWAKGELDEEIDRIREERRREE